MKPIKFIKRLIGGLNLSVNYNDVPPVDFVDGYDVVDRNPRAKNENGYLQPCNNTEFAYDLGRADLTDKKYKATINVSGLTTRSIYIKIEYKGFYNGALTVPFTTGDTASILLASIQAAFAANTQLASTSFTGTSISGSTLNLNLTIYYYQFSDYYLTISDSLDNNYPTDVFFDAVSAEKVGILRPVCFSNINTDEQIFATTNIKNTETIEAVVSRVASSEIIITFASSVDIEQWEEVYIYPVVGGSGFGQPIYSGNGTLTQISGTVYSINGSINPFSSTASSSGNYYVVRNYRTLSTIGYAQKNEILKKWSYIELLRSNKLNFRTSKQLEGRLDITSNGLIYNFSDGLNAIKRLIYKNGTYGVGNNGFLTIYNPAAIYSLDTIGGIGGESNLQLGANTSKVSLAVATTTGLGGRTGYTVGSKKESCYTAFVRFKTIDGAYTTYSKASNVLWLHSSELKDHYYGLNSGSAIQITVEQIPFDVFESVQVGIIEFTSSSWVGYSLPEIQINGQETIYVGDNGFNPEVYTSFNAAADLLEQIPFVFENAESLLNYNNYMLAANVNLYKEYDLTEWAQTINLGVRRREIPIGDAVFYEGIVNTAGAMLLGINNIEKCSNEWMSYMPYDHYRFCVFIDWENGSPTSTYWINDVSFDPDDNSLINGDAVCTKSGGILFAYQYFLEAYFIDINYLLPDGKLLKDVIKDIRFGRALCSRQVQTTGLGLGVFNDGTNDYVQFGNDVGNTPVLDKLALYSPDYQNVNAVFNWKIGDVLKSKQANRASTVFYEISNVGMSFFDNGFVETSNTSTSITSLENSTTGGTNSIALFSYLNYVAPNFNQISIREAAAVKLSANLLYPDAVDLFFQEFYYIRPYGAEGAYPLPPQQTRFFVLPQNKWFNKGTHTIATTYEIYGGDCFPTISSYKTAENTTPATTATENNFAVSFYSFNRTNTALRSGRFPYYTLPDYLKNPYLTDPLYNGDRYTYDSVFTPRYIFQNQVAFNPNLTQLTNQFSSIYYSNQGFGNDLAGGNRIWLPQDMKTLESKYGAIVHMEVLFGLSGQNILVVWQERRFTAQYFDNTANIVSNSGQLLLGTGTILERTGQDLTQFGCEHKWLIKKGKNPTGKDIVFWIDFNNAVLMRFGSDGTSNIVGDISPLINNDTSLAILNIYSNNDAPAQFFGCHAVWDNINMEYIATLRLAPKETFGDTFQEGQFKFSTTEFWGFEQFPVIYKSLTNDNTSTPPSAEWETISGYDSEYFKILTIVWNEKDNKFKTFRSHSPKIYGQWNNTFLSSHPVKNNLIYEHNSPLNEALYYAVETKTTTTAFVFSDAYLIFCAGITSTFPNPFIVNEREKYIVTIQGKNYEIVDTDGANILLMASVDNDDILPQVAIPNFSYSVVNSQDPYIEGLCNNSQGRYFHFVHKSVQADDTLKRTEYESGYDSLGTPTTISFTNKSEEEFYNGRSEVQIKQDTTNTPTDNEIGLNNVEGIWMKFKSIWRWGKQNRLLDTSVDALESQKTK